MLVLTRKTNQSITLGNDIKISILSIDGDRVSVGIDAPRSVKIFRTELLEETRDVNLESVTVSVDAIKKLRVKETGAETEKKD
ncbi:carbon storage regulator CsrA [Oscillospiraceae bacterium OttesenSCG-928-G22]|nr:carbon storage regulator CsrA [Oscillospiraceae bacterium OttesenSCG-928-G22]